MHSVRAQIFFPKDQLRRSQEALGKVTGIRVYKHDQPQDLEKQHFDLLSFLNKKKCHLIVKDSQDHPFPLNKKSCYLFVIACFSFQNALLLHALSIITCKSYYYYKHKPTQKLAVDRMENGRDYIMRATLSGVNISELGLTRTYIFPITFVELFF